MRSQTLHGTYDVVVIGAGIMGSCISYQIAKRGHSVILIEQFDFLHKRGSSHGESRTIRLTYPQEYYTGMVKEAFQLWESAQQEAGYMVYTQTAHLDIGPSTDACLQAVISSCRKHGVGIDVLNREEAAVRLPLVELPENWIAVVTQEGGVLHASKAVAMFQFLAAKNGAILRERTAVKKIAPGWSLPDGTEGVLVVTTNGSVLGRKCVIAAGAWTTRMVKEITDLELPIRALHTTLAYWQVEEMHSDAFKVANGFPTFASYGDPYIYGTPSIEYPGLVKISLHAGYICDVDNRSLIPDINAVNKYVSPWVLSRFRGKIKAEHPVLTDTCLYSMTPDEDYILDYLPLKSGERSSILLAAGFSGHGFKMGPVVGRVMADLALQGVSEGIPFERFSISRFLTGNKRELRNQVSLYADLC